jgi:hypothetical protein
LTYKSNRYTFTVPLHIISEVLCTSSRGASLVEAGCNHTRLKNDKLNSMFSILSFRIQQWVTTFLRFSQFITSIWYSTATCQVSRLPILFGTKYKWTTMKWAKLTLLITERLTYFFYVHLCECVLTIITAVSFHGI